MEVCLHELCLTNLRALVDLAAHYKQISEDICLSFLISDYFIAIYFVYSLVSLSFS